MRSVTLPRPDRASAVDVCAILTDVCHLCEMDLLTPKGITYLIDVDSGPLAAWRCNIIGRLVRAMIENICRAAGTAPKGGRITVALHHKGEVWVLAVADEGLRTFDRNLPADAAPAILQLARPLKGTCRSRLTPRGAMTAVLFSIKQPPRVGNDSRSLARVQPAADQGLVPLGRGARSLPRRVVAYH